MVARMAFFTPIPAGIGVLESVLPWLTALLGLGHTLGFSLCLMIRSRDLLFNLTGLGLTVHYLTCRKSAGIISRI
jgi:glycosyltransferase 2 family protein